jgi:putative sugar O-methyltransferase
MHAAARANSFLLESSQRTVCEIGGGLGVLAFYLAKTCSKSVTVADLPIVSIIQGYYLMKSLGPEIVHLAGEDGTAAKVNIIPYWELDDIPEKSISIFVNIDSIPEIDTDIAERYARLINNKGSDLFFSINHETRFNNQNVVQDLVERAGGFRRVHRSPHWMMRGYVEEIYRIEPTRRV